MIAALGQSSGNAWDLQVLLMMKVNVISVLYAIFLGVAIPMNCQQASPERPVLADPGMGF